MRTRAGEKVGGVLGSGPHRDWRHCRLLSRSKSERVFSSAGKTSSLRTEASTCLLVFLYETRLIVSQQQTNIARNHQKFQLLQNRTQRKMTATQNIEYRWLTVSNVSLTDFVLSVFNFFLYRAMLRRARYCHYKSSVCPSVRPSVHNGDRELTSQSYK